MNSNRFCNNAAGLSRGRFLRTTGGFAAFAGLAGCGNGSVVLPLSPTSLTPLALAANPTAGGLSIQLPPPAGTTPNIDISTITDFNGFIGRTIVDGTGLAGTSTLYYEADLGFMQGEFRATNGAVAQGTFSFV